MDPATLVGLIVAVGVIGWSFVAGGDPPSYWDGAAFLLVFGGVIGATMIHYKFNDVMIIFNALMRAFMIDIPLAEKVIKDMVEFGRVTRRDGAGVALDGSAAPARAAGRRAVLEVGEGVHTVVVR